VSYSKSTVSSFALQPLLTYAKSRGLIVSDALASCQMTEESIFGNYDRISEQNVIDLLQYFTDHIDDPLFGYHSGKLFQPGAWSYLGPLFINSSTFGKALEYLIRFQGLITDKEIFSLSEISSGKALIIHRIYKNDMMNRHITEYIVRCLFVASFWIRNPNQYATEVGFAHPEIYPGVQNDFRFVNRALRGNTKVIFNEPFSYIGISHEDYNTPLFFGSLRKTDILEAQAEFALAETIKNKDILGITESLIKTELQDGVPSRAYIAKKLEISERSFQRKLQAFGTSYQKILSQVRQELTHHYLKDTDLTLEEISSKVGFNDTSSFHRIFKQWSGCTPAVYRK